MFKKIKDCLNEFEDVFNKGNSGQRLSEEEEDVIINFNLSLAKALIQEKFVDSKKVSKIIWAATGLSDEITVNIQ